MRKVYVVSLLFNLETFYSSLRSDPDVQCCRLIVAITNRLQGVNDRTHLLQLLLCQIYVSCSPVLVKTLRLHCSRESNHALRRHPGDSNLRDRTVLELGKLLEAIGYLLIGVEVFALELGNW